MTGAAQLLHVKLGAGGYLSLKMPTCSLPGLVLCGHQQKGALRASRVRIFNAVLVSYLRFICSTGSLCYIRGTHRINLQSWSSPQGPHSHLWHTCSIRKNSVVDYVIQAS